MTDARQILADHDAELRDAVLAAWAQGHDTLTIAQGLLWPHPRGLSWLENRVGLIIRAEQDRRYRERTTARLTADVGF